FDAKLTGKGASGINRQSITITNTGTLPLTLIQPKLSNNLNNDFSIGSLPRLVLNPGQSEFLEIAYKPLSPSNIVSSLTIGSNAGPKVVTLNGTAQKARLIDDNPTQTIGQNTGNDPILVGLVNSSGVDGEVTAGGVTLRQSVPNPGQDLVSIGYRLPVRGDIRLELFDGNGQLVRVLDAGMRDAGEKVVSVDVSHLASGVYHYRLTGAGQTLNRTMNIVR
ncbi:MAG: T9SS type A sorting domain-containing protein, partial [Candidatus Kapaibacterium sp.]